jgi:hypothetical protein
MEKDRPEDRDKRNKIKGTRRKVQGKRIKETGIGNSKPETGI